MTAAFCLLPDWQGCVVMADSNHYTPQSFTCHWPSIYLGNCSFLEPANRAFYHISMSHSANILHDDMVIVKCLVISTDCWCSLCTAQVLLSCPHNVLETVTPVQILTSHHRLVRSRSQTGLSVVPPPLGPGPGRPGTLDIAPCARLGRGQRGGCVHFTICFVPQLSSSDQIQHWYCVLNHLSQFYSM